MFFFIAALGLQGQSLRRPVAAPYIGLGSYSLQHMDVFSFISNQASLAQLKNQSAGVYCERRFLLSELNNYTAAIGIKTESGNFGVKTNYSGFTDYNETQIGLAYGRKLGSKTDVGAQINYNGIKIAGYGNTSAISFEIGAILHVSDRLHAGVHVSNPVGGKFGKEQGEKLPAVHTIGLGYDASEKLFVSFETEKEEDRPVNINAGFQYRFINQVMARAGISTATSSAWMGIGIMFRSFRLDVTTGYHSQLGLSPGLLLLYQFKKERE